MTGQNHDVETLMYTLAVGVCVCVCMCVEHVSTTFSVSITTVSAISYKVWTSKISLIDVQM